MLNVLTITFPIFATIALGYVTTRRGMFLPGDMAALGRFVVNIALPALVFTALTSRPLAQVFDAGYVLGYAVVALATMGAAWLVLTLLGFRGTRRAVGLMGSACPNSGYMGYPILMMTYPAMANSVLALNVMVETFLLLPFALVMMELSVPQVRMHPARLLLAIGKGMLKRPMIRMLILGLAVNALGLPVPAAVNHLAQLIAAALSAVALFYIGGSLVGLPLRGNLKLAGLVVGAKLLVMPVIALAWLKLAPGLGPVAISQDFAMPLVITAAMPMLGLYSIFAADFREEGMASMALLGATAVSFVTISAMLLALH